MSQSTFSGGNGGPPGPGGPMPGGDNGRGRGEERRGSSGIERMPPQAVEVEEAVLGAMLIDGRAVARAIELLDPEQFYHAPNGKIFRIIVQLYERSEAVDQLTVAEALKNEGILDEVGGRVYLASLAAGVATAANMDYHANIVRDRYMRRRLIEDSSEITERAFGDGAETQELLGWAEAKIFAIASGELSKGFEPIESIMGDTFEEIERAHNRVSTVAGVDTGFTDLNEMTSGFQKGDLIILAARPSVGKTAFALSMARNAAVDAGVGVAVFSLEMNKQQIAQRLLSTETRVDLHKLRTGRLTDEDFMHLTKRVGKLAQAPIYVDDTPGITVLEARAKARRLQREYGIGLIVVDYLQLMTSHEQVSSRVEEISRISRGLKGLAKELDVPVLSLSQLSRAVESRTDRRPQLSDLRESGSIEQDADIVAFIYRPDIYGLKSADGGSLEGLAEIIIGKQRNGPTGSVHLMWNAQCATYENMAPEWRVGDEDEEF